MSAKSEGPIYWNMNNKTGKPEVTDESEEQHSKRPFTIEPLDRLAGVGCQCGQEHGDQVYMHSECHTEAPTHTYYQRSDKTINVECAVCRKLIIKVQVARTVLTAEELSSAEELQKEILATLSKSEARKRITKLALLVGAQSPTEVLNRAIAFYDLAIEHALENGGDLIFKHKDGMEEKLAKENL